MAAFRPTPMTGQTRKDRQRDLADAHELMVRSNIVVLPNPDCPACTVPPEMYQRLIAHSSEEQA